MSYVEDCTLRKKSFALGVIAIMAGSVWFLSSIGMSTVFELASTFHWEKTQVKTTIDTPTVALDQHDGVFVTEKEYESPVFTAKHGFNALGMKIRETLPAGTEIHLSVRTAEDDVWGEWMDVERDEDGFVSDNTEVFSKLIPVSTSYQAQYRALLHTDNAAVSPELLSVELIYINSNGYWTNVAAPLQYGWLPQASAEGDALSVITRTAWGADETLRIFDENKPQPQLAKIAQDLIEKFAQENPIVRRIRVNENGEKLTWPLEYTAGVDKIVIHHTAKQAPQTLQDSADYLRAVYYYHTISRGWGDIGYNYIIDPFGNVYEGRYGGDRVVGAHAGLYNRGSVGIALMGNFENEDVSPAQLRSLIQLVAGVSKKYGINPSGQSVFRGQLMPNVVGHDDVGDTSCPGDSLYALLTAIRRDAQGSTTTLAIADTIPAFIAAMDETAVPVSITDSPAPVDSAEKTVDAYQELQRVYKATAAVDNPSTVSMEIGQQKMVTVSFENTGDVTWNSFTYLSSVLQHPGITVGSQGRVALNESSVQPGARGTFTVFLDAAVSAGRQYPLEFNVIVNGIEQATDRPYRLSLFVAGTAIDVDDDDRNEKIARQSEDLVASLYTMHTAVTDQAKDIRVKLDMHSDEVVVAGTGQYTVYADGVLVAELDGAMQSRVTYTDTAVVLTADDETYPVSDNVRFVPVGETITQLVNFSRPVPWDISLNDNEFRGVIEVRVLDGTLGVINELPLEHYIRGIAEVSESSTHYEKKKVMSVVSRTYALYYMTHAEKFPGAPYHLDDLARNSQKYLGYGFEKRSPDWVAAAAETRGQVVTYGGELVKTPYFSQSDGRTRSATEVWGWTTTPYLQSVSDPLCESKTPLGHGVGLSGCGAEIAAQRGFSYTDILQYYYTGIDITTFY